EFLNQSDLPSPLPFLQAFLPLDRIFRIVELLEIHESDDVISFCETLNRLRFVFCDSTDEIIRHANIQCATDPAGQNVDVETPCGHFGSLGYWIARSSRAMTVDDYSPACNLRGSGNSSGAAGLTTRAASVG